MPRVYFSDSRLRETAADASAARIGQTLARAASDRLGPSGAGTFIGVLTEDSGVAKDNLQSLPSMADKVDATLSADVTNAGLALLLAEQSPLELAGSIGETSMLGGQCADQWAALLGGTSLGGESFEGLFGAVESTVTAMGASPFSTGTQLAADALGGWVESVAEAGLGGAALAWPLSFSDSTVAATLVGFAGDFLTQLVNGKVSASSLLNVAVVEALQRSAAWATSQAASAGGPMAGAIVGSALGAITSAWFDTAGVGGQQLAMAKAQFSDAMAKATAALGGEPSSAGPRRLTLAGGRLGSLSPAAASIGASIPGSVSGHLALAVRSILRADVLRVVSLEAYDDTGQEAGQEDTSAETGFFWALKAPLGLTADALAARLALGDSVRKEEETTREGGGPAAAALPYALKLVSLEQEDRSDLVAAISSRVVDGGRGRFAASLLLLRKLLRLGMVSRAEVLAACALVVKRNAVSLGIRGGQGVATADYWDFGLSTRPFPDAYAPSESPMDQNASYALARALGTADVLLSL